MEIRILTILLGTLSFIHQIEAFTLNNSAAATFKDDEISINVASLTCNNLGITNDELLSLAAEAADRFWNQVPTSRLRLKRGNLVNVAAAFGNDVVCTSTSPCVINPALRVNSGILIACNTNPTNYSGVLSVLGVTVPNNISGGTIRGALILVNDQPGNSFNAKERDEQIAIIAHELGHAVGLGHSQYDKNLMYAVTVPTRMLLGQDDADGITWLYPTEQPFGGCGSLKWIDDQNTNQGWPILVLGFLLSFILLAIKTFLPIRFFRAIKLKMPL